MTEEQVGNPEMTNETGFPNETEEEGEDTATGDVYSLIQWVIVMLTQSAWQWMGLHKNAVTGKVEKDMAQAKVAIDSVVYLSDQIAPHVSEEQQKAFRQVISDLRVNYVQQMNQESQ